jgi:hypothetical protein
VRYFVCAEKLVGQPTPRLQEDTAATKANKATTNNTFFIMDYRNSDNEFFLCDF